MRRRIIDYRFLLSVLLGCIYLSAPGQLQAQSDAPTAPYGIALMTEEEAARLRLTGEEWLRPMRNRRTRSDGPSIVLQSPTITSVRANPPTITTVTPLDFFIVFEPRAAPINMASLEVRARKGFFSKSLTDRLKPYIDGTTIQAKDLNVPTGTFHIEIEIADNGGQKTFEEYYLQVSE